MYPGKEHRVHYSIQLVGSPQLSTWYTQIPGGNFHSCITLAPPAQICAASLHSLPGWTLIQHLLSPTIFNLSLLSLSHHFPQLFTLFSKNQIFMPSKIFRVFLCKFTFSFFPFGFLEFYFLSFMVHLGWAVETCLSTRNTPTMQVHTDPYICLSNHHGPCLSIL